jgi:SAM-dependent methyltransferase
MAEEYRGYEVWKAWSPEGFGKYSSIDSRYYDQELTRAGVGSVSGLNVLEIGFGNGSFAGYVRDSGGRYVGVEANAGLVETANACGFDAHSNIQGACDILTDGVVDIVVAFDVFEHLRIDDLRVLLGELRRAMRGGAALIARVPSGDSPISGAIEHGDTTHRSIIGSSMVRQLAVETGFEVYAIRAPAWPLRGVGVLSSARRVGVAVVRAVTYPVLRWCFLGGGSAVLTPCMVVVLRRREDRQP